jgi:hypothetical protein
VNAPRRGFLLDEREHATVLAALRHWQRDGLEHFALPPHDIGDIATNGGTLAMLQPKEIDALCERLNEEPVATFEQFERMRDVLDQVTAAMETMMAHHGASMSPEDRATRERHIAEARALLGSNVVTYQSSDAKEAEIAWWREQGWTWEYPGFLMSPLVQGYSFTVGLDEPDVPFCVQVTTDEGVYLPDYSCDCQSREEVLEAFTRFKSEKGVS